MRIALFFLVFYSRIFYFKLKRLSGTQKCSTFHVFFRCIRRACRAFFRHPRPLWVHHPFEAPAIWRTRIHRVRNQFASVSAEVVSAASTPCTDTRKEYSWKAIGNRRYDGILRYCEQRNRVIEWIFWHWSNEDFCFIIFLASSTDIINNLLIFFNIYVYYTYILSNAFKIHLTNNVFLLFIIIAPIKNALIINLHIFTFMFLIIINSRNCY